MSLKYKYDDEVGKEQHDPAIIDGLDKQTIEYYPTPAVVRSITIINSDGVQETFFYSDLTSLRFDPNNNEITLKFIRVTISLKGINLEQMFEFLSAQKIRIIKMVNERYLPINEQKGTRITGITIEYS